MMPAEEIVGNAVAKQIRELSLRLEESVRATAQARKELSELQCSAALLVRMVGKPGTCRWCNADVYWVIHQYGPHRKPNGQPTEAPYDPTGINHWATCPLAKEHRHGG